MSTSSGATSSGLEHDLAAGGQAGRDEVLDDLLLAVDGDRAPGQLEEVDAVAAPVEGQLDAAVGEALAVEAIGEPELAQQLDGRVLEHAGAHAVLDVGPVALLEHDAVDVARREQVGEHEPGRTGADDRHLGRRGRSPAPLEPPERGQFDRRRRGDRLQLAGDREVPARRGTCLLDRGAGLQGRQRQLARDRVRAQDADIGDDHCGPAPRRPRRSR